MSTRAIKKAWGLLAIVLLAGCVAWAIRTSTASTATSTHSQADKDNPLLTEQEALQSTSSKVTSKATAGKHEVIIRRPAGPPRVDLGLRDAAGQPVTAACSTCHTTRPANHENRSLSDLDEFHQTLNFAHGKISCLSCHNPNDYDTLHLADGKTVEYSDVMTLCAQCHGPQTRDYEHGAHGGMNGYWDLSRGPRTRNNCIDCHNPHAPGFPAMQPTFKPKDRFLSGEDNAGANSHE